MTGGDVVEAAVLEQKFGYVCTCFASERELMG
jgi:hypothetical protein